MDTRATGEPGDAAAAAPQDQPLQSAMKWWPGAPACALVAPHQARVADNVSGQDRRQFALLTGHKCPWRGRLASPE
jgi:hypothetical protein